MATQADTTKKVVTIIKPHITEKANALVEKANIYTFEVFGRANKKIIASAVKSTYKVIPVKVSVAKNPSKRVFAKGKVGSKPGITKAYVYLKKGDKIEFV